MSAVFVKLRRPSGFLPNGSACFPTRGKLGLRRDKVTSLGSEVRQDADAWRDVRITLNHRRPQLTKAAVLAVPGCGANCWYASDHFAWLDACRAS